MAKLMPTQFQAQVLGMLFDPGDGTGRRFLNVEEKDKLKQLYGECRKDSGLSSWAQYLPPHMMPENERHNPYSRHLVVPTLSELAADIEMPEDLVARLGDHGICTVPQFSRLRAPVELECTIAKLRYQHDTWTPAEPLQKEEVEALKLLYEHSRLAMGMTTGLYYDLGETGLPPCSPQVQQMPDYDMEYQNQDYNVPYPSYPQNYGTGSYAGSQGDNAGYAGSYAGSQS